MPFAGLRYQGGGGGAPNMRPMPMCVCSAWRVRFMSAVDFEHVNMRYVKEAFGGAEEAEL